MRASFLHANPGLQVSQVKTSRLKKNGQEPDAIWIFFFRQVTPAAVSCLLPAPILEKQPRQMNRIIAEFFVRALCISERKDIGRFFSEYTNERIKMGVLCENNL
jgi:hypothetical protein